MEEEIEAIYERGVFLPLKEIKIPERSKVLLKIKEVTQVDELKLLSYLKLLREGEEADELFEF